MGFVPATNIITRVVAPIRAEVPRSTSVMISEISNAVAASGMMKPKIRLRVRFSKRTNHHARKNTAAVLAISDG
jgi:ribosomal protein L31E